MPKVGAAGTIGNIWTPTIRTDRKDPLSTNSMTRVSSVGVATAP